MKYNIYPSSLLLNTRPWKLPLKVSSVNVKHVFWVYISIALRMRVPVAAGEDKIKIYLRFYRIFSQIIVYLRQLTEYT